MPINPTQHSFQESVSIINPEIPMNIWEASPILKKPIPKSSSEKSNKVLSEVYRFRTTIPDYGNALSKELENSFEGVYPFITQNALLGIEIEVENIPNLVPLDTYWSTHEDGSLRNYGREFVSGALNPQQCVVALDYFFKHLKQSNPDYSFSNRTSIHVHLNVRDMTQDQIYAMVLLYAIFEKFFYQFAGKRRLNSIFCVPLFRSNMLSKAYEMIYGLNQTWHKYSGLNLRPMLDSEDRRGYGTIEFRHLYGTDDQETILSWLQAIICLRHYAMQENVAETLLREIETMNTTSSYMSLFMKVFPAHQHTINKKDIEECVSNIKREIFPDVYRRSVRITASCQYWELANNLGIRG